MMVTHGNRDQLSRLLHEQRGAKYEDLEEEFYTQAEATSTKVDTPLQPFETFIGKTGPTGEQIQTDKWKPPLHILTR